MISLTIGRLGVADVLGIGGPRPARALDLAAAATSLGVMVALSVWTKGAARLFCMLLGVAAGFAVATILGRVTAADLAPLTRAPLVHLPIPGHIGWSFDAGLAVPFAVGALAAALRASGDITICQRVNDAEWARPEMGSISRGVLADGLSTVSAGLLGTVGVNTYTSSVGLSVATGATSRRVAYAIGGSFLTLAFLPKVAAVFAVMPVPVLGAALLFSACFVFIQGLQLITAAALDPRKTFVIGLSFMVGIAVDLYPTFFVGVPAPLRPFVSSALVLGTVLALLLNFVFRLGVRRAHRLLLQAGRLDPAPVRELMATQGAAWGASRDVIDRATRSLLEGIESIAKGGDAQGPLQVEAQFGEYNMDLRVSCVGPPPQGPEGRPAGGGGLPSEPRQRRPPDAVHPQGVDGVRFIYRADRASLTFHFDY